MPEPDIFSLELTEKGRYAIAIMVASFLAGNMEYDDLLEYYIDEQTKQFMADPEKLKEAFRDCGEDLIAHVAEMNKKLR